jgi:signal transduction histidine kinase
MDNKDVMSTKQIEILIAEDSATQAEHLRYILEKNGFKVWAVANGKDALQFLKRQKPDIVVTDILMPEMSGYELCKKIRSDADLKDVPVIIVTALSDPTDVLKALEAEADNFITKPYDENFLVTRIQHIIANKEFRKKSDNEPGVKVFFSGKDYYVTAERTHMLDLLLSTYESAYLQNRDLIKTRIDLEKLNDELEVRVLERTMKLSVTNEELLAQIEERKRTEQELETYKRRLEELVEERTSELTSANKELESFIYSVSHDLRGPLRAIYGFSEIMMKDIADNLDQKGKRYLSRIHNGTEKMSRLVDDLLNLSKISRQEIRRREVNVSAIAASIIAELREAHPGRIVEVDIKVGLTVFADPGLIEILLSNLLGNAWKFTEKTEHARIEFGTVERDSKIIYYVRDNGAGFDHKYEGKMFLPFHRLHSEAEFEGTGIGLAIVDRIIGRHGGKVWAEGIEGKGATVYFSLT